MFRNNLVRLENSFEKLRKNHARPPSEINQKNLAKLTRKLKNPLRVQKKRRKSQINLARLMKFFPGAN